MGFLREAVRAWLRGDQPIVEVPATEPKYPVSYGGTKFEVCTISNGYLIISARGDGYISDMTYVEKGEDIGPTITAKLVEYKMQVEMESREKAAYLAQGANKLASVNYTTGRKAPWQP